MTKNIKEPRLLRLVYALDKEGDAVSYWHCWPQDAERIFMILGYLQKHPSWISIQKLAKEIKKPYSSVWLTINKIAGAIRADILEDDEYKPIVTSPLVSVKNALYNKKANLNPKLRKLKPVVYVRYGVCI